MEKYQKIPEWAGDHKISTSLARRLVAEGKIPHIRLGLKRIIIPVEAAERALEKEINFSQ